MTHEPSKSETKQQQKNKNKKKNKQKKKQNKKKRKSIGWVLDDFLFCCQTPITEQWFNHKVEEALES